jgi:RNA polymerase sigma-70 factor (ECF subfamily)
MLRASHSGDHRDTVDESSDIELMQRVRNGDDDALTVLVHRYQGPLINFFRSMGLHSGAEDAVQDTFLRLYRYRDRYEPRAAFRTFIYMIARQVSVDAIRKGKRYGDLLARAANESETDGVVGLPRGDRTALAEELLMTLPDAMREVVVMSLCQGMKYEEISVALDIPVGTVKSRMFNAMLRLKEALRESKN